MKVTPIALSTLTDFMHEAKFVPPRWQSIPVFVMSCAGDDLVLVEEGATRLVLVLRHDGAAKATLLRMAIKQGPGDAMDLAYRAVAAQKVFAHPTVLTDVPIDKLRNKLTTFTHGAAEGATVRWSPECTPQEPDHV